MVLSSICKTRLRPDPLTQRVPCNTTFFVRRTHQSKLGARRGEGESGGRSNAGECQEDGDLQKKVILPLDVAPETTSSPFSSRIYFKFACQCIWQSSDDLVSRTMLTRVG